MNDILLALTIQYYICRKYNYFPAEDFIMYFRIGDISKANIKLIELLILVFVSLFIAKCTLSLFVEIAKLFYGV